MGVLDDYILLVLIELIVTTYFQNKLIAACPEEERVIGAIKKENEEIKKKEKQVKELVDRIAAEIERTSCAAYDTGK